MITVTKTPKTTYEFNVKLDDETAGYLYNLLYSHVGGELTQDHQPLGQLRTALREAGVTQRTAHAASVRNQRYAMLYRTAEAAKAASSKPTTQDFLSSLAQDPYSRGYRGY